MYFHVVNIMYARLSAGKLAIVLSSQKHTNSSEIQKDTIWKRCLIQLSKSHGSVKMFNKKVTWILMKHGENIGARVHSGIVEAGGYSWLVVVDQYTTTIETPDKARGSCRILDVASLCIRGFTFSPGFVSFPWSALVVRDLSLALCCLPWSLAATKQPQTILSRSRSRLTTWICCVLISRVGHQSRMICSIMILTRSWQHSGFPQNLAQTLQLTLEYHSRFSPHRQSCCCQHCPLPLVKLGLCSKRIPAMNSHPSMRKVRWGRRSWTL